MSNCFEISPDELVVLSTFITLLISLNMSNDDLNVVGNLLQLIGSGLLTKAAQQQALQDQACNDVKCQISDMEKQLEVLKRQIK